MTVECKIGPIELDAAQLVDGDINERNRSLDRYLSPSGRRITQGLRDKNEGFALFCKKFQALQISGLADWKELEWIDSSSSLVNNDDIIHRGWGVLGKTNLLVYPGEYCDMEMEMVILSPNEDTTLLMDYVGGAFSQLVEGYQGYVKEEVVEDTFITFDTTKWENVADNDFESGGVVASGGKLTISGKTIGTTLENSSAIRNIMCPIVVNPPFTVKANLSNIHNFANPGSHNEMRVMLAVTVWKPGNWEQWKVDLANIPANDADVSSGYFIRAGLQVYAELDGTWKTTELMGWPHTNGKRYNMLLDPISTDNHEIKVRVDEKSNFYIYLDGNLRYSGPIRVPFTGGFVVGLFFAITDTTSAANKTYSLDALDFELSLERPFPQQILLPPYSQPFETPTTYRETMWGDLPVYEDPSSGVPFKISPEDYDKASARAWSSDNEDGELRRVFNFEEVIDLGEKIVDDGATVRTKPLMTFYIENGIIKVEPTPDSVKIYAFESLLTDNQHDVRDGISLGGWAEQGASAYESGVSNTFYKTKGYSSKTKSNYDGTQYMWMPIVPSDNKVPVVAGAEYIVSSLNTAVKSSASRQAGPQISWYNSSNVLISNTEIPLTALHPLSFSELPMLKVSAPATAAYASLLLMGYGFQNNEILYYDSCQFGRWKLMEEIHIGDQPVKSVRILEINREQITIQVNRTTWTIRRGDPVVKIDHPYDSLGMVIGTSYYHDGTTTSSPASGADITMQSQNHCLKTSENTTDILKILLIQMTPTTIKSDQIPATINTGIGVYDPNETPTDPSGYQGLVSWFVNRGRQKIKLA